MDHTLKTRKETELAQNAVFIRGTYRKAAFTGMLSILSVNINVFVDGILVGSRLGADALAAINLSLPLYLALCVVGSFLAAGTERRVRRILRHRPHGAGAWLAAAALAAGILLVFATAPAALPAQAAPEALRADPLPQQSMAVHAAPQTGSPALQPALYDAPDPYCDFVLLDRRSHVELLAMEGVMRELQETYHARFVRVTMESEARGCVSIYRPPVR